MLTIGLTGGIGSGKSAASSEFEALGITVVDADIVSREVVAAGTPALTDIKNHFGSDIVNEHGALDRAALRKVIFSHPNEKQWLESLLHPIIRVEILKQLEAANSPYAILVSPLLFETNQHELVNQTLLIDVPVKVQLERASARDQNSLEQIQKIIDTQLPRDYKLQRADDIISNDSDLASLKNAIYQQHLIYLERAREHGHQG